MSASNALVMSEIARETPTSLVRDLFASPIGVYEWQQTERLNRELREAILKRFASSPSVVQSGRYAWQSEHHIERWPEPCFPELMAMIKVAAAKMAAHLASGSDTNAIDGWEMVSCFANVTPPGGHSNSHNHIETGGVLSGVYYVDIGECEPQYAGRTVFEDHSGTPQLGLPDGDLLSREFAFSPKPGVACMFSAAQRHYVEPYRGKGLRISIAFNLKHPNFSALYYPMMRTPNWWWRNFRGLMILRTKIPEKLRAAAMFVPYAAQELRHAGSGAPLSQRMKTAFQRAQVDASAKKGPVGTTEQLPDKRQLV